MEDIFDFGFTLISEDELDVAQEAATTKAEVSKTEEKLELLYKTIQPLLTNLKGDVNKDIIKWPGADRIKKIEAFESKLAGIVYGS